MTRRSRMDAMLDQLLVLILALGVLAVGIAIEPFK